MARIPETFNVGALEVRTIDDLLLVIERMYIDLAVAVNSKPNIIQRTTDGQTTDTFLSQGDININLNTNKVEMLTNHVDPSTVTWTTLS